MWWAGGIACNTEGFAGEMGAVNVLKEGERGSTDLLSCPHYAMEGLAAGCGVGSVPHSDAAGQDALYGSLCRTGTWWGLKLWLFSAYRGSRDIGELSWPGMRWCWSGRGPQWRALTLSTAASLMLGEGCWVGALLMSTKISFVLSIFRER